MKESSSMNGLYVLGNNSVVCGNPLEVGSYHYKIFA
jgi:hypothetical protein